MTLPLCSASWRPHCKLHLTMIITASLATFASVAAGAATFLLSAASLSNVYEMLVPCLSIICTNVNLKARDPRQQFHPPRWPRKYWKEQGSGKQQLTHVLVCKTCQDRTLFNCFYNARLHLLMSCQGTLVMVICLTTGRFWWVHRSGDCSTHSIVRCYNISARLIHFTQQPNLCLITRYLFHNQQVVWEGETVARKSLLFISGHWYRHWKE